MLPKQGKLLNYDRLQPCLGNNKNGKAKYRIGNKTLTNLGFKTISICIYIVMNQELLVNNSNLVVFGTTYRNKNMFGNERNLS